MLTHIDKNNMPTMVDVTDKAISFRMAKARSMVQLPAVMKEYFQDGELRLKKGPVFQTAIIAGTMAVKKTHELIPFCHQIPVESCKFDIQMNDKLIVTITCTVKTTFKTGVEMEALTGAMTAALTIYDMCKAVSHEIVIQETKLLNKTGGKSTMLGRPTYGLVLTGGLSKRMESDKALISYKGKPHAQYIHEVLKKYCDQVYLSARPSQWKDSPLEGYQTIVDKFEMAGPMGGMLSAFEHAPDANWLVVACDLVHFNEATVEKLLANINDEAIATCYKNDEKGFPEALCALYTPKARMVFTDAFMSDVRCPVKILKNTLCELIDQEAGINLANINTKEEFHKVSHEIS
ncbi:MAG TPA: cyclic pyranopterin monophosphate synthase MoaC [Bacteriovoracaceae bacterium]|nr:cyclic pyranopterin monophosphate synthase MoaC [Bacteriovoracaceae bacterium]